MKKPKIFSTTSELTSAGRSGWVVTSLTRAGSGRMGPPGSIKNGSRDNLTIQTRGVSPCSTEQTTDGTIYNVSTLVISSVKLVSLEGI